MTEAVYSPVIGGLEEAHASYRELPTPSREVELADGRMWRIHRIHSDAVDEEVGRKIQMVLDHLPMADTEGRISTQSAQKRERIIEPLESERKRLSRMYDLEMDMAERLLKAEEPALEKVSEASSKAERASNRIREVEKRIQTIRNEASRDEESAGRYCRELALFTLSEAYPGLRSVPEAERSTLLDASCMGDVTLAFLGVERYDPKKKAEEPKPHSNGSTAKKSSSV